MIWKELDSGCRAHCHHNYSGRCWVFSVVLTSPGVERVPIGRNEVPGDNSFILSILGSQSRSQVSGVISTALMLEMCENVVPGLMIVRKGVSGDAINAAML